eukprot:scaffold84106_cov75-Phaeocystis_antarctica.AAC.1
MPASPAAGPASSCEVTSAAARRPRRCAAPCPYPWQCPLPPAPHRKGEHSVGNRASRGGATSGASPGRPPREAPRLAGPWRYPLPPALRTSGLPSSLDVARRHSPLALDDARCHQLFIRRACIQLLAQRVTAERLLQLLLGVHDARRHAALALGNARCHQFLVGRASTQLVIERVTAKRHLQPLLSVHDARCHALLALDDARGQQLIVAWPSSGGEGEEVRRSEGARAARRVFSGNRAALARELDSSGHRVV